MVLQVVYTVVSAVPSKFYVHIVLGVVTGIVLYAFAQGRSTTRERDLHARTFIVTGAFTPLGLTLISSLASRGAHVIALSPYPLTHTRPALLIQLLRSTTKNEHIFAEHADLASPESVHAFCTKFLTGDDQRLDGIVFAHEYRGVGSFSFLGSDGLAEDDDARETPSVATFLMLTLLLPALLVAPVERDIRIINVVNPFYAAAAPSFTPSLIASLSPPSPPPAKPSPKPLLLAEGHRALRTIVLTRHLQRILDALPNRGPALGADGLPASPAAPGSSPAPSPKSKSNEPTPPTPPNPVPSNIIAVSVSPGISRADTMAPLLRADRDAGPSGWSVPGFALYTALYPLLWLLAKSTGAALQSVLHALFLPTPFRRALAQVSAAVDPASSSAPSSSSPYSSSAASSRAGAGAGAGAAVQRASDDALPEEVLKPGALYRECSVVTLRVPPLPPTPEPTPTPAPEPTPESAPKKAQAKEKDRADTRQNQKKQGGATAEKVRGVEVEDDGEYGGEEVGRVVWEWYEAKLKAWEAREKAGTGTGKRAEGGGISAGSSS